MSRDNTRSMTVLFIVSWMATAAIAFLYVNGKKENSKLGDLLFLSQQNAKVLQNDLKDYAKLKQEKNDLDKNALDYIQWKFVLKQEILVSSSKISSDASKLKDTAENKELAALLYNNLGLAYTMSVDFDAAINAFERAVSAKPNVPDSYYSLGLLYSVYRNNKEKAVENYTKFLELSPKSPQAGLVRERIKSLSVQSPMRGSLGRGKLN